MKRRCIQTGLLALAIVVLTAVGGYVGCRLDGGLPAAGLGPGQFVLYITGYTNGNMEPCNCPGQPLGGLSRRQTQLESLRARHGHGLLLDVGNMMQLAPDPVGDPYMLAGYGRLGYDAIGVGDQELDRGPEKYAEMAKADKVPLVASNVSLKNGVLGPRYRLIGRAGGAAGQRVLVLGVLGPRTMLFSKPQVRQEIEITDPVEAVRTAIGEAESASGMAAQGADQPAGRRFDLVIALADLDSGEREPIVPQLGKAGVNLVVLSTNKERESPLERIGDVPVIYAPPGGRYIATAIIDLAAQPPRVAGATNVPVPQTLRRDQSLWELYQSYTYDAQQRQLKLLDKIGKVKFVPPADCGQCHPIQYEWWKKQPHGRAWATIVREGRTSDPYCMRCHTTGYGFVGGFRSPAMTPQLANVGCQDCHQVELDRHKAQPLPKLAPKVDPSVCRTCHTDAASPKFDIDVYGPKARCPKGAAVTPKTP